MLLEVESKLPVRDATEAQVRRAVTLLRSYGPSSFASLTNDDGNYLQVAGGGVTCMLERRDASTGRHYRAYQQVDRPTHPDGTLLIFGGGEIPLRGDEWFAAPMVTEAFVSFLKGDELPSSINWRDVTDLLQSSSAAR